MNHNTARITKHNTSWILNSHTFILSIFFLIFISCFVIQFKSLAPLYYRDAAAAILVYDITSEVSCNNINSGPGTYWQLFKLNIY